MIGDKSQAPTASPSQPSSSGGHSLVSSQVFWVMAGSAVTALIGYGIYLKYLVPRGKDAPGSPSGSREDESASDRARKFIKNELRRLRNPRLVEVDSDMLDTSEILQRKDFYDLLFLIQLQSKLKLQSAVSRNQRERVQILGKTLQTNNSQISQGGQFPQHSENMRRQTYEAYVDKAMTIMQNEFNEYEEQFSTILKQVGIDNEVWESSREYYIQNGIADESAVGAQSIENIDKRVYEFLPQASLPKSLTREMAKQVMMDVNFRAAQVFKSQLKYSLGDVFQPEYEPLLMETLAFDFAFLEYGYNENAFRFAIHKYELQRDPEIKDQLEEYLSS